MKAGLPQPRAQGAGKVGGKIGRPRKTRKTRKKGEISTIKQVCISFMT